MDEVTISFTIPGRLRGKGRHRARALTVRGKTFVQTYPDTKTVSAEAMVRDFAAKAMKGKPPIDGPVALHLEVYMSHPKSWSKKKKHATDYITGKPDADNQIKLVGDACNGILWKDDSQISEVSLSRYYDNSKGDCVEVRVYPLVQQWVHRKVPLRSLPIEHEKARTG